MPHAARFTIKQGLRVVLAFTRLNRIVERCILDEAALVDFEGILAGSSRQQGEQSRFSCKVAFAGRGEHKRNRTGMTLNCPAVGERRYRVCT